MLQRGLSAIAENLVNSAEAQCHVTTVPSARCDSSQSLKMSLHCVQWFNSRLLESDEHQLRLWRFCDSGAIYKCDDLLTYLLN